MTSAFIFTFLMLCPWSPVNQEAPMILLKDASHSVIQIDSVEAMNPKYNKRKLLSILLAIKKNKVDVTEIKQDKIATFQESLGTTLMIGQIFSIIAMQGVNSRSSAKVKFAWCSWRCGYLILSLFGQFFITVMCIHRVTHSKSSLNETTPIIFYGITCTTMLMFLRLATHWPDLVHHIAQVEEQDPSYDRTLKYKCNITCAVVLSLSLVEHILSLLLAFTEGMLCHGEIVTHKNFVTHFYPWVFNYIPYSFWLGVITQFLHFQSTFIWNFSDLFVICMSYYLISRLDHINKKVLAAQGKYLPETFWRTAREEYGRTTQLIRKVDEVINGVIFIVFANNLFFICFQLFNTLEDGIKGHSECSTRGKGKPVSSILGGYEAATYFLFSLIYLIARSTAVSLIAAQVNTSSNAPATVLYDVPSPVYCIEVQRFLDQVNGDSVALSGLQFFSITRGLVLTVAGTIVTYELVMVQFNT